MHIDTGLWRTDRSLEIEQVRYESRPTKQLGNRPARVLHLVSSGGLYGAEQVILNLARTEDTLSYIGVLYGGDGQADLKSEAEKRGFRTVVFESRGKIGLTSIFQVRQFLCNNDIDILHTHGYKSDVVGFLATLANRTRWVATNHVWHPTSTKLRFYESVDAFVLRFARGIVAVSGHVREELISASVPPAKILVIHNGIEVDRFRQFRSTRALKANLGLRDCDVVVTIVGRLSPEKGHKTFLQAAGSLCASDRNHVRFLIVGDGPLRDELRAEVTRLNLTERVIFTGFTRDMPEIYALSDVMVNASFIEGLPMTLLEAMASGVPLVAARTGGISEIVKHDKTGFLIDPHDVDDLKSKIEFLIDDPGKRQQLATAALEFVTRNHSAERMCNRYRRFYRHIMGGTDSVIQSGGIGAYE